MSELSRLRWLCRRGMKELDVVLTGYLERRFVNASGAEQQAFRELLDMPDPDLFVLLMGRKSATSEAINELVGKLKTQVRRNAGN